MINGVAPTTMGGLYVTDDDNNDPGVVVVVLCSLGLGPRHRRVGTGSYD